VKVEGATGRDEGAVLDALRGQLNAGTMHGPETSYFRRMWLWVIGLWEEEAPPVDPRGSIPYIPFSTSTLGVELTDASTVLDIGCYGGYGLFDVAMRQRVNGEALPRMIGIDVNPVSIKVARELAESWTDGVDVTFFAAAAEALPVADGSVDIVTARLVLPYVRIREALSEIVRALKPGACAILQPHAPAYYAQQFWRSLSSPVKAAYYLRPLFSGLAFSISGHQFKHRWLAETAMGPRVLEKECRRAGLTRLAVGHQGPRPIFAYRKPDSSYRAT